MQKKYAFGKIAVTLLSVFGLLGACRDIFQNGNIFQIAFTLVLYAAVAFYALVSYKVPHGNHLKYLMLYFAISLIFVLNIAVKYELATCALMTIFAIMLICYIAGRLDKIQKNKWLCVFVLACLIHVGVSGTVNGGEFTFSSLMRNLTTPIVWIDICGAYFVRHADHKEAGLCDKE